MRRTKPTLIYKRTKNLRAVQLLLGHTKLEWKHARRLAYDTFLLLGVTRSTLEVLQKQLSSTDWEAIIKKGIFRFDLVPFQDRVDDAMFLRSDAADRRQTPRPEVEVS